MLYVGLDLSRKRLDWQALDREGERVASGAVPPDRDGLDGLIERVGEREVLAVIESMSGARFVHDQLEIGGWDVRIADAVKARGLAPLACKTDTIDCWVLAGLARLDLVPEIWLPDPAVRAERERTRFRQHLVKHRSSLKNRVHAILFQHGVPNPSSDLFGAGGRRLLARLALPEPWASTVRASLELIDTLDEQIDGCERKLVGYSGLCPRVEQSGERDRRGPLRKNGPTTCAGRSSKPRTPPLATPPTARSAIACAPVTAANEARRSPPSRSRAG